VPVAAVGDNVAVSVMLVPVVMLVLDADSDVVVLVSEVLDTVIETALDVLLA